MFNEPIKSIYIYKDNYNKKPIEFGDVTFEVGEIHMDKRITEFKADGTQLHTYNFTCANKATAWTGKPIDKGFMNEWNKVMEDIKNIKIDERGINNG